MRRNIAHTSAEEKVGVCVGYEAPVPSPSNYIANFSKNIFWVEKKLHFYGMLVSSKIVFSVDFFKSSILRR